MKRLILLFQCKDQKGIVAKISEVIFKSGGNIIAADQYSTSFSEGYFFMRVEFMVDGKEMTKVGIEKGLKKIAASFKAEFTLYERDKLLRMGICVSRPGHCLADLLYLWSSKELSVEIPFVISNFQAHQDIVESYGIPFYFLPATRKNRLENRILEIAKKDSDFLVLARYMLVLSDRFLSSYGKDIINIHHGFLPSFKGKNPYKQALEKGVKVIGATSHFVNGDLDEGPIISQRVEGVSHRDDLRSLVRKGKHLEKVALADAISAYIDYRIIKHNNKTIVF
jgi:formyltetrahydrofolate deformylase